MSGRKLITLLAATGLLAAGNSALAAGHRGGEHRPDQHASHARHGGKARFAAGAGRHFHARHRAHHAPHFRPRPRHGYHSFRPGHRGRPGHRPVYVYPAARYPVRSYVHRPRYSSGISIWLDGFAIGYYESGRR